MIISISLVLLLLVFVWLLLRTGRLNFGHALLCALFGFALASSSIAPYITSAVHGLTSFVSGISR